MSAITQHPPAGDAGRVFRGCWTARLDGPQWMLPDVSVSIAWGDDGRARLYGPHTRGWWAEAPPGCEAVGVDLRPGVAALVPDVREVLDETLELDALLPAGSYRRFVDTVGAAASESARLATMQREVLRLTGGRHGIDPLVGRVMSILRADPTVSASALAAEVGLGARQLHRRCSRAVGFGPSTLRRLIRLEGFLRLSCSSGRRSGIAELAADSGYTDQQHLSHECRELTGRTPTELLACA